MKLPAFLLERLGRWAQTAMLRQPDFVIGDAESPYLLRWWVIPRNRWFNIYLHEVLRSDDDRALHDHPWVNCSILLAGGYDEHRIRAGGIEERLRREAGSTVIRMPGAAHRLEVTPGEAAVSLFITGPVWRHWGFHCPQAGWRHWKDFTGGANGELVGRGCGEMDPALATPATGRLFSSKNPRRG